MLDLPNEVLLLIFDHLTQAEDPEPDMFPSLRTFYYTLPLLEVCRQWRDLFFTKVYRSLELHFARRQLYLLARSLRENPRMGTSIRRLWIECLRDWGSTSDDEENEDETMDPDDNELVDDPTTKPFHDLLEKASRDQTERRRWQRALLRGSGDAWMAICFYFLPNLQSFTLEYLGRPKTWIPLALSRIASGSIDLQPRPLQHLEEVIIDGNLPVPLLSHLEFFPYFHLPSMRSFRGCEITELQEGRNANIYKMLQPPPKSSGITELALRTTHITSCVIHYITACANLRVFMYEHTLQRMDHRNPTWSPGIVYNALITQKQSLEVLYINFLDVGSPYSRLSRFIKDRPAQWFGSLQEFTQLREIYMPLDLLLDYRTNKEHPQLPLSETMPSSVENLYLGEVADEDFAIVASALFVMLSHRKRLFPSLLGIELWLTKVPLEDEKDSWFSQLYDTFARVEKICLADGIEFRYSYKSRNRTYKQFKLGESVQGIGN